MTDELFVMIPGYENRYLISNLGRVISFNSGSEMAQYVHRNGHMRMMTEKAARVRRAKKLAEKEAVR